MFETLSNFLKSFKSFNFLIFFKSTNYRSIVILRHITDQKLENVHWWTVPVQIVDPIVGPPGEYV